jgi:peroxiredoxin
MKNLKIIVFALLLIASFLLSSNSYSIEPGDKAKDFKVVNFDGKTYQLSAQKDAEAIVIMFLSTECPFVQAYNDRIVSLVNTYQSKNVVFWGINSNNTESVDRIKEHYIDKKYNFPVLKDKNNIIADMFEATRTPEVFVLDKNLTVLYHGRIDDSRVPEEVKSSDLKNALDEILAGNDVTSKITKQFGCTIKR